MDFSPSKRRKTSLSGAVPVTASNTNSLIAQNDDSNASRPRSSYMSPTKASLARFNPELLRRPGSVEPQRQAAALSAAQRARTEDRDLRSTFETSRKSPVRAQGTPNGIDRQHERVSPSMLEDTPSKLPNAAALRQPSIHLQTNGQSRTPTNRRRQRSSHGRDTEVDDEPSLPSTPSQLGLEPPAEKPRGLLFQTSNRPSKTTNDFLGPGRTQDLSNKAQESHNRVDETQLFTQLGPRTPLTVQSTSSATSLPHHGHRERTLRRTENRLLTVQERLTRLSLQLTSPVESSSQKKSRMRMKKQLAQDTRLIRSAVLEGSVSPKRYDATTGSETLVNTSGAAPPTRDSAALLAQYLPFSVRPRGDRASTPFAPRFTADDESREGQQTEISKTAIRVDDEDSIRVQQFTRLLRLDGEAMAGLNLTMDPVTQTIITVAPHSLAPWVQGGLESWIVSQGAGRTLQKLADVMRQFLELVEARQTCWAECVRTLRELMRGDILGSNASPTLDQRTLGLLKDGVETFIDWQVIVSDEGVVQSEVKLRPNFPHRWREFDTDGVLDTVVGAFDNLIRERGVKGAIQTIAKVLYPVVS